MTLGLRMMAAICRGACGSESVLREHYMERHICCCLMSLTQVSMQRGARRFCERSGCVAQQVQSQSSSAIARDLGRLPTSSSR